jgi:hypothetical protein
MITLADNHDAPMYDEVKEKLKIDPEEQVYSRDRLDEIIDRARRS